MPLLGCARKGIDIYRGFNPFHFSVVGALPESPLDILWFIYEGTDPEGVALKIGADEAGVAIFVGVEHYSMSVVLKMLYKFIEPVEHYGGGVARRVAPLLDIDCKR